MPRKWKEMQRMKMIISSKEVHPIPQAPTEILLFLLHTPSNTHWNSFVPLSKTFIVGATRLTNVKLSPTTITYLSNSLFNIDGVSYSSVGIKLHSYSVWSGLVDCSLITFLITGHFFLFIILVRFLYFSFIFPFLVKFSNFIVFVSNVTDRRVSPS